MSPAGDRQHDAAIWLDVVAAVEFIGDVHHPGFTVWDALIDAIATWCEDRLNESSGGTRSTPGGMPWDDRDPLRTAMEQLFAIVAGAGVPDGHCLGDVLSAALTVWLRDMVSVYNDGHSFTHPSPQSGWPSGALANFDSVD